MQADQIATNPTLSALIADKTKTDKALNNLVAAIENGLMSDTTNKRLRELEQQKKEYEKKVKKLELQAREWKAKKNIEFDKKQYENAIKKTDEVLKNDLGTITIKNKKKK